MAVQSNDAGVSFREQFILLEATKHTEVVTFVHLSNHWMSVANFLTISSKTCKEGTGYFLTNFTLFYAEVDFWGQRLYVDFSRVAK